MGLRDRVLQQRHLAVEHRDVELLRFAGAFAVEQRALDRPRAIEPGGQIADRDADAGGGLSGISGHRHHAAHRLHDHVVGRARGVGAGVAEAGNGAVNKARVARMQRRGEHWLTAMGDVPQGTLKLLLDAVERRP